MNNSPFAKEGYPFIAYTVGLTALLTVACLETLFTRIIVPAALSFAIDTVCALFFPQSGKNSSI